jgi:tetratricopeptide (TPR) repeat protein
MGESTHDRPLDGLLQRGKWTAARKRLRDELARDPENHWLLTQFGVTFYEQRRYRDALEPILAALEIVPDCPLALWNLAGTLGALGKPAEAVGIYTWLLRSDASAADDPCWESAAWADALKTDCVYRLGVCFQHLRRRASAAHCYRQYVNLLLDGMTGSYPIEDAARHIRDLDGKGPRARGREARKAIDSTLDDSGIRSLQGRRRKLPRFTLDELLAR